jgi:hypothetical protein
MFKKSLLLIITMLCLVLIVSCASSDGKTSDTTTVANNNENVDETTAGETVLSDNLPDTDMEGTTVTFLNYTDAALSWALKQIHSSESTGDLVNDAIYTRNLKAEERFNVKIAEVEVADAIGTFKNAVMAGDAIYDIGQIGDEYINQLLIANVMLSWDSMPYINLDAAWWNQDANNVFQLHGSQYAAIGDFNLAMYSKSYVYFFNKDMYNDMNYDEDLYTVVKDGRWTADKLVSVAKDFSIDLNGDGVFNKDDQYGLIQTTKVHFSLLVTGAGVKFVDVDSNGVPYFAIPENPRSIAVLQKLLELHTGGDWYFRTSTAMGGVEPELFKNGQSLLIAATMWNTEMFREYDIDIGILPAPKYDEAQENYHSITVGGLVSAIPKTMTPERAENVSILLEALSFDSRINTLPIYKEVVLQTKYARDAESSEMIDIIFNSQTYDLGVDIWTRARSSYIEKVFHDMKDVLASTTESLVPLMESEIQKTVEAVEALSN